MIVQDKNKNTKSIQKPKVKIDTSVKVGKKVKSAQNLDKSKKDVKTSQRHITKDSKSKSTNFAENKSKDKTNKLLGKKRKK